MVHSFDASSAECIVFTFKEGLLSAVAHDLQFTVTKFKIEVDEETRHVAARFDPASLRVVGAMHAGRMVKKALKASQKTEIESNLRHYVLEPTKFAEIRFISSTVEDKRGSYLLKGKLWLHGHERQIKITVREEDKAYTAEYTVHQPDFGITPYSALFGTLKVSPEVKVQLRVPIPKK